ncbi:MAG: hypothetical protein QGF68_10440 [Nitrospinota bacterium]|jgi:hypothetical protein|nr:hypothetical protein [Nitrospinota bacterium]HJM43177.1 hypothetical protein [Nitrospinota bacterium]
MKTTKIFKAVAFSALLLAGTTGAAPAQDRLDSGEPYPGFFQSVTVPSDGPIVTTRVATEAPGNLVAVEGRSIRQGGLSGNRLAGLDPEAIIGMGLAETDEDAEEAVFIANAK